MTRLTKRLVYAVCYTFMHRELKKHPEQKKDLDRECWACGYACGRRSLE